MCPTASVYMGSFIPRRYQEERVIYQTAKTHFMLTVKTRFPLSQANETCDSYVCFDASVTRSVQLQTQMHGETFPLT